MLSKKWDMQKSKKIKFPLGLIYQMENLIIINIDNKRKKQNMDNIIYMFDIPLFTYDGYADVMEDGTQYQALEWKLIDMEKYNGKYVVVGFDGSLRIYEAEGEKLFEGSLLDSKDFVWHLKNKIK